MGDLSANFSNSEFACPCCGQSHMDSDFIIKLQQVRDDLGVPFSPVDGGGYRCPQYNGSDTGAHVEGKAIDPDLGREYYYEFIKLCMKHGFTGFGVKNKNGRFQMHADTAEDIPGKRPRPWIWSY